MFFRIIGSILLVIGLAMAGFGVYFIFLGFEAEGWTGIEGEVVSVVIEVDIDIGTRNPSTGTTSPSTRRYYPSITYAWTVGGERYSGDRYRLGETHEKFLDKGDAIAAASQFKNGMPITVFYQEEAPSQAVLDPSLSAGVFVPLPLGLLFLASGWFLFRNGPSIEAKLAEQEARSRAAATP